MLYWRVTRGAPPSEPRGFPAGRFWTAGLFPPAKGMVSGCFLSTARLRSRRWCVFFLGPEVLWWKEMSNYQGPYTYDSYDRCTDVHVLSHCRGISRTSRRIGAWKNVELLKNGQQMIEDLHSFTFSMLANGHRPSMPIEWVMPAKGSIQPQF